MSKTPPPNVPISKQDVIESLHPETEDALAHFGALGWNRMPSRKSVSDTLHLVGYARTLSEFAAFVARHKDAYAAFGYAENTGQAVALHVASGRSYDDIEQELLNAPKAGRTMSEFEEALIVNGVGVQQAAAALAQLVKGTD